jgi:flagellar biosynthesis activator protein FlaF
VYSSQLEAYRQAANSTISGRDVEAAALTRAALLLIECQNNWSRDGFDANLHEAMRINQVIWSIFQGELIKEDNPLPQPLKQDILNLSLFVDKQIIDVLAYPAPEKLDAIIKI